MTLTLRLLPGRYAICRLEAAAATPDWAGGNFVSITRTASELSIICEEQRVPPAVRAERGWCCFGVEGPIPFETPGVAAALAAPLAASRISVFFVATFDTDYLLVKEAVRDDAIAALRWSGVSVS